MRFSLLLVLLLAAPCGASDQTARRIPVEDFAELPFLRTPVLSPDGQHIVAKNVIKGVSRLLIINADHPGPDPKIIPVGKITINAVHWAGNNRLLLEVIGKDKLFGFEIPIGRLIVVDLATGDSRIADRKSRGPYGGDVLYVSPAGDTALVASQDDLSSTPSVKRVDLATGDAKVVEKSKPDVWDWFVDDDGVVRGGVAYDKRRWKLWYRSKAGEPFKTVQGKFQKDDDSSVDRFYFSRDGDKGTIVTNERNGRFGVYHYDFSTGAIGQPIFESPVADVSEVKVDPATREIAGVRYHEERWKTFWVDPKLKSLQARVDRAIPGADNEIIGDATDARLLIWSNGASDPGTYFLFDRAKSTMDPVIQPFSKIDPADLATVVPVHFRARDGLDIPAYLTLPKGKDAKKLPLIILPHGGPFARDEWTYDPLVQFLANRGYAVLQPQFRGSTGYGKDFVSKGYGEWGRKMQDDLDDGLDWLVASGKVDPKRVCIVGGSYGGYAALWGAIRNPERYKCAASFAGVTDLEAQLRNNRKSFSATRYFREWRTKVEGETHVDLRTVSPLAQAAKLKVPVLIVHGEDDETVPVRQGKQMVAALEANKADVTSKFYKEGGHSFSSSEDLADFLRLLDAFLAKNNPS
ncbi:alpha/beta fold hydrolase [Sphingomonas sp.]|uniref:alpha/beta hydrolase family protein n=1 Tax=Sphingomonas sp. TaxID=28214 RepID=UPI0025D99E85|nr:alpha/beta fold hydrolase [Sphingomonas sp.]